MDRKEPAGEGKMTMTRKTYKDDDPHPFVKKSSSKSGSGVDFDNGVAIAVMKRHAPNGSMDKIFQQVL
jgi:hypothetical protein